MQKGERENMVSELRVINFLSVASLPFFLLLRKVNGSKEWFQKVTSDTADSKEERSELSILTMVQCNSRVAAFNFRKDGHR